MWNYVRAFLLFSFFSLLFLSFQNFGVVGTISGINHIKEKEVTADKQTMERLDSFYHKNAYFQKPAKYEYTNGPKDFFKKKIRSSEAYTKVKSWLEVEGERKPLNVQTEKSECNDEECEQESLSNEEEWKFRYQPLKSKALLRYRGAVHADVALHQNSEDLELSLVHDFSSEEKVKIEHRSKDNKTFVNYFLSW